LTILLPLRSNPLTGKGLAKLRTAGTVVLVLGAVVTAYAAVAFFLVNQLPPNGGFSGRLPSLYLLFAGMAGMFVGSVVRNYARRA